MGKLRQRAEGRFVCSLNLTQRSEKGTIQLQFSTRKLREGSPSCGNASSVCVCETVKQRIHHLRWCILGLGFPDSTVVTNLQCRRQRKCGFDPWIKKIPWRRKWQRTPVSLLGESHGQKSLWSYSPWGHKELDTTEVT